jgi:hypothetical protein
MTLKSLWNDLAEFLWQQMFGREWRKVGMPHSLNRKNENKQKKTIMIWYDTMHDISQLPVQSVSITTEFVSSNPIHGEVYSIQHYVIKLVSDLRQVGGFLRVLRFPPLIKPPRYNWNIVESGVKHHKPKPYLLKNVLTM